MAKIKAHEFISVDGVYESPSWTMEFPFDPKMGEAIGAVVESCTGLLLGRNTFEMFAPAWSARSAEDHPGAPFFNESPKYVVSSAQQLNVEWSNSTLLGPYSGDAIRDLKDHVDGDLYGQWQRHLGPGAAGRGLLDELHLFLYPVLLGDRDRLFTHDTPNAKLSLSQSDVYDNGVVHLAYARGLLRARLGGWCFSDGWGPSGSQVSLRGMSLGLTPRQSDLFATTTSFCESRVAADSIYGCCIGSVLSCFRTRCSLTCSLMLGGGRCRRRSWRW